MEESDDRVTAGEAVDAGVWVVGTHGAPADHQPQLAGVVRAGPAGLVRHRHLLDVAREPERSGSAGGISLAGDHPATGLLGLESQLSRTERAAHHWLSSSSQTSSRPVIRPGRGNLLQEVLSGGVQLGNVLHGGLEHGLVLDQLGRQHLLLRLPPLADLHQVRLQAGSQVRFGHGEAHGVVT